MAEKVIKYTTAAILLSVATISVWFLVNNLQRFEPALYSLIAVIVIALIYFLSLFANNFLEKTKNLFARTIKRKYFNLLIMVAIALTGIIVRLSFYFKFSYSPISDPLVFYDTAQKISDGYGVAGDTYIAFFPHLAAYDNILGLAMKIISEPWLATIMLNTVFDIGSAVILYLLVKGLAKRDSKLPIIAFSVWLLNPLNILFSVLSLPVVIVNFFIVATIFLVHLLSKSLSVNKLRSTLILSLILGIIMGYGNSFRQIFPIAIIALFLLFIYIVLTNKKTSKQMLLFGISFLVVGAVFSSIQKVNLSLIAAQTDLRVTSSSGWNVYIGSNSESDGTWNQLDQDRKDVICKNVTNNEDCHKELQEAAIDRYEHHGIMGTLNLFIRKLYVFSSNQSSVYNANDSIDGYIDSTTAKTIGLYTTIFLAALFASNARFLYSYTKRALTNKSMSSVIIFASILMLGFFLSSVLVETSPRYAQIIYPIFTLFGVLGVSVSSVNSNKH